MTLRDSLHVLRHELRPTPQRARTTAALTLGTAIVITVMVTFRMPMLAIGPYLFLLGLQRDTFTTRIAIVGFIVIATLVSVVLTGFTVFAWDDAWLRVSLFALLIYGGYYLMATIGEPRLIVGPMSMVSISMNAFDGVPNPNMIFGQIGWLWAMFGTVIAALLLVQSLFPPPGARELARTDMRGYLANAERHLLRCAFDQEPPWLDIQALTQLRITLAKAAKARALSPRQLHNNITLATAVDAVVRAASSLPLDIRTSKRASLLAAAQRIGQLRRHLLQTTALPREISAIDPDAARLHSAMQDFERVWRQVRENTAPLPAVHRSFIAHDFSSNPGYHDFALRASLANLSCYVFMTAVHWPGIHTCMVTCVITAFMSEEARAHKQHLRLLGGLFGGACAFAVAILLLPHLHTFIPFLIVLALGTSIGGWIAHGSERSGYAGLQFVLALYLMLLQSTHPVTEVAVIRDRWFGILVGTFAMWIAFDWLRKKRTVVDPQLSDAVASV